MFEMRFTVRRLLQAPGYSVAIVLTLALTIAACTAVYSAVKTILLRPFAIAAPEELVVLWGADPARHLPMVELSYQNFSDWTRQTRSFVQAAAMGSSAWPTILESPGSPVRVSASGVSSSFFSTLQVPPSLGRVFRPDDELPHAARVVVLSHHLWVRRFGSDPRVVGRVVHVADAPHAIVGVMPAAFDFPRGTDLWMPVLPVIAVSPSGWNEDGLKYVGVLYVIGRLRAGITVTAAAEELERAASAVARSGGSPRFGTRLVVTPLAEFVFGPTRQVLWHLFASVLVLLLIGCGNIAGVMLTRVSHHELEYGVRMALGASPLGLARTWVAEAFVLASIGGAAGLLVALWLVRMIVVLAPDDIPRVADVSVDGSVALFCIAATFVTSVLCGLLPAWRAASHNPADSLRSAKRVSSGPQTLRARSMLVTLQVALGVVLLIGAGLVVRSFINLRQTDLGFSPAGVVALNVTPRSTLAPPNVWVASLLDRLRTLPSVQSAGAVFLRPLARGPVGQESSLVLEEQQADRDPGSENPMLNYEVATPSYFQTMRIPLLGGRVFDDADTEHARPVAVVGESTANRLWPGQDPVGKRMLLPTFSPQGPDRIWRTVVGVVANVRYRGLDDARYDVYVPASAGVQTTSDLVVRGAGDLSALARTIQAEIRRIDPETVVDAVTSMEDVVRRAMAPWALAAWMFSVFALLALVLSAVGLVGLVSLDVVHRHHEFAVRLAVGADRADILRRVFRRVAWRVGIGTGAGLLAAAGVSRVLQSVLYGVDAFDPATYLAVTILVAVIAGVAAYAPARRAADANPMTLLRG